MALLVSSIRWLHLVRRVENFEVHENFPSFFDYFLMKNIVKVEFRASFLEIWYTLMGF